MDHEHTLLSIIELGGYPDFAPLYERLGFEVVTVVSMRKALAVLKTRTPRAIVAEFNYQSDFRDRTSSLESLLAVVQRMQETRVVVFYDPEQAHQLDRLRTRFPIHEALPYPIDASSLEAALKLGPSTGE
jgi:ActR/RegA family two-component response regulator